MVLWTTAVLLVYAGFGFFIVPGMVRGEVVKQLSNCFDRPVTIRSVALNPFTFTATFRGLSILDHDGAPLVSWEKGDVNCQLASLFSRTWRFKEVRLSQPRLRVQVNRDYTLNYSVLINKFSQTAASKPMGKGKPRACSIKRLRLTGAKVSFVDLTPRLAFRRIVGPFEMTLTDFMTDPDSKITYAISGTTDGGERFSWKGHFYLGPFRSDGDFSVEGISLAQYAPWYQDWVRFEIKGGVVNLSSTYRYERSATPQLLILTNTNFALQSLKVAAKGAEQNVVEVSEFVVSGASGDAMAHTTVVDMVKLTGGRFTLRRNHDLSVNAVELLQPVAADVPIPGGIFWLLRSMTNVWAMLRSSTNLWTGTIRDCTVAHGALDWEDVATSRPTRLALHDIAVHAKNVSNRGRTNLAAELSLRWGARGTIRANLAAALLPPSAELKLAFDQLDLEPLDVYLEPFANIRLLNSKLGLNGTVRLHSTKAALPELGFKGDVWLDSFAAADGRMSEDLLQWEALRFSGVEANLNPPMVAVSEIGLEDLLVRLVFETNGTFNLMTAFHPGETSGFTPGLGEPVKTSSLTPSLVIPGKSVRPTTKLIPAAWSTKICIGSVVLTNARVQFMDRSLQPNVNLTLEQLSGAVSGLSSEAGDQAVVNLRGTVDHAARAELSGILNPWHLAHPSELKLTLKNLDLAPFSIMNKSVS